MIYAKSGTGIIGVEPAHRDSHSTWMPLYLTFALTLLLDVTWTASRMVFSLYALALGAEPFAIGILAAMLNLFPLLLSWPIGTLSDRIGPRPALALAIAMR